MSNPVAWVTGAAIGVFALVMLGPILKELWIELTGGRKQRTYGSFSAGGSRREQVGAHDHMGVRLTESSERVKIAGPAKTKKEEPPSDEPG